jgi:hypothetical protein
MFASVMQQAVQSALKRVLNRFVKEQILEGAGEGSSASAIHLRNLTLKEHFIDEYLAPHTALLTESATVDELRVDIGWTSTIHLTGICIVLSADATGRPDPPLPEHIVSSCESLPHLGASLYGSSVAAHDEEKTKTQDATQEKTSQDALFGIQEKLEEFAASFVYLIRNVHVTIKVAPDSTLALRIGQCMYTEGQGVTMDVVDISLKEQIEMRLEGLKISPPGLKLSPPGLLKMQVACMNLAVFQLDEHLLRTLFNSQHSQHSHTTTASQCPHPSLVASTVIDIDKLTAKFIDSYATGTGLVAELHHAKRDFHLKWSQLKIMTDEDSLDICDGQIGYTQTGSSASPPTSATETPLPFEEQKIFLFHSQPKPLPVGDLNQTSSFVHDARSKSTNSITIRLRQVELCAPKYFQVLRAHISKLSGDKTNETGKENKKNDRQTKGQRVIVVDAGVEKLTIKPFAQSEQLTVEQFYVFASLQTTLTWSCKITQVHAEKLLDLRHLRLAGQGLTQISCDARKVEIENLDALLAAFPKSESEEMLTLMVRLQRIKLLPCAYCPFPILGEECEIFTLPSRSTVITCGQVTSDVPGLSASNIQVQVPLKGQPIKISVATLDGAISPEVLIVMRNAMCHIQSVAATEGVAADVESKIQPRALDTSRIVQDYINNPRYCVAAEGRSSDVGVLGYAASSWLKISIEQFSVRLVRPKTHRGYVEIALDHLKVRCHNHDLLTIAVRKLVCFDRLQSSVWNKAVIVRSLRLERAQQDWRLLIGSHRTSKEASRKFEDVTVSLDQNLVDYVADYMRSTGSSAANSKDKDDEEKTNPTVKLNSFYLAALKARIDYKPNASSSSYLRFVPVRGAVIKVEAFDMFEVTTTELGMGLALHTLNHFRNLSRILSSIKPLKTPAHIFHNVTEFILIPLQATPQSGSGMESIVRQAKYYAKASVISVLELGPAMNVRRVGGQAGSSVHAEQPTGIKDGFVRAGQNFAQDVGTVFAFLSGDLRNVDLLDLPLMIIRPVTAPVCDILNGVCNQLDHRRMERLLDKYK